MQSLYVGEIYWVKKINLIIVNIIFNTIIWRLMFSAGIFFSRLKDRI